MDAPTTKSADSGSSGDDGGGWFTPRKKTTNPAAASAEHPAPEPSVSSDPPAYQGPWRDGREQERREQERREQVLREQQRREQEQRVPQGRTPSSGAPDYRGPDQHRSPDQHRGPDARIAEGRVPEGGRVPEARRPPEARTPVPPQGHAPAPPQGHAPAPSQGHAPAQPAATQPAGQAAPPSVSGPASGPASASGPAAGPASASGSVPGSAFFSKPKSGATALAEPPAAPQATAPAAAPASTPAPASTAAPGPAAVSEAQPSPDAVLIQRTMAEVGPVADKVTSYFYALLFLRHPDLRMLFPASMDTQRDRLLKALLTAAENLDNTEVLVPYLKNLGRGHRKYGTEPEHYPAVGEALIGALSRYASSTWDEETEAAWVRTYTTISQIMIDSAAEDEQRAPAWWFGEVVSHELRTPDIAVITVRPDQPYPFLAGQYASLETPWWPRVWRHYSFASAPRSDGLLTFHVKAIPAGWVSNALVHRARPGDTVRLGPPAGSMTVDHATDNGLLCVGGGTGIAPIKALVEDIAEHGRRRPVEVFYGARSDHDLYDIDTMLQLQDTHPWLSVRPVIDTFDQQGHRGQLPDAVKEFGPWDTYDAYLSGPPGMIRNGVHALKDAGIPANRIRHDSLEELVGAGV
ncbi:globin domain-containing protein [Streptomyces sp. Da 82-17]|uniref:globin domain-containing protein n=1 Tax=Streptomyces sp. Da 82-17 TaxID=3377116 RepID=UPI0038D36B95